ncbi:MAG: immune inhibitor A [Anaerolineales bacterium]|nr:immune inhibitor A [Chloroflexota bacterium]MBL6979831.1 immune inhibitor A [Anaerolineales bacterium]
MNKTLIVILVILVSTLLCCCMCFVLVAAGGLAVQFFQDGDVSWDVELGPPTETPIVLRPSLQPTEQPAVGEDGTPPQVEYPGNGPVPVDTLRTLEDAVIPPNDLRDLAKRLQGRENIPLTVDAPVFPLQVGDKDIMWVTNVDTNENSQIDVTLQYVTDHVYFWIEDGISFDKDDLAELVETFEAKIYPTNREFFGSEWSPGVDGDPHLYIIFADDLGFGLAGYYSSADENHPLAHEYSNAHEAFVLNSDNLHLTGEFTLGVLAHEFQHMIHWYGDRNESSWLNEGFSELASHINGYDVGGFDYLYTSDPDIQLNDWPNDSGATTPHYGASFLFVDYFLDRFGDDATKALVAHPENGLASVDAVLNEMNISDPLIGKPILADDLFLDWVLATYIDDPSVADGRYNYKNYPASPTTSPTESIYSCPTESLTRDVHQYGVDYIRIACAGTYNLHFEGSVQVGVFPQEAYSGAYAFWSNKGDESDITLTRSFDFSEHLGPLTLTYWTWYDLEEDYDYVYLEASIDGENWQILTTPSGTPEDPSGNSFGWGYNGLSGGDGHWIQEIVDISQYSGQEVQLRFEYITDAAVNGEGLLLDDIAVSEVDYFADFEADSGGWEAAGFVRIRNILPQTYRLALIKVGDRTEVEFIELSADNVADIPLEISDDVDEVILVVTGTTRYTRQKAAYRFEITQ